MPSLLSGASISKALFSSFAEKQVKCIIVDTLGLGEEVEGWGGGRLEWGEKDCGQGYRWAVGGGAGSVGVW